MTDEGQILVTGAAGFIGFSLSVHLVEQGYPVLALDVINDYYDPALKLARLAELGLPTEALPYGKTVASTRYARLRFVRLDLSDRAGIEALFAREQFGWVAHLAAQAGVRYSLHEPHRYIDSNIVGFLHVLEGCRHHGVQHLVYASSSSVYGQNEQQPFSTDQRTDQPISLYAATKRSNELMAYTYSHLYGLACTGLRFFTVYGPWGRPDMAYYSFTRAILAGERLPVFNYGKQERDFTYIDDITAGVLRVLKHPPTALQPPWRLYNIGAGRPVRLGDFIDTIERQLGQTTTRDYLPAQPGDVTTTYADTSELERDTGYRPQTSLEDGIAQFVDWYRRYHATRTTEPK